MTKKISFFIIISRVFSVFLFAASGSGSPAPEATMGSRLGEHEAIRTYVEFADGGNRGMYDHETGSRGFPDEDFDSTTAMVINWHRLPEANAELDAKLAYRKIHPSSSAWKLVQGSSREFWHREERVNRVVLTRLEPNAVYEFKVIDGGRLFRFRTMPSSLDERPVKIVMTADHQQPDWSSQAHDNARMVAIQKPDMFVVAGDFVNCEGVVSASSAQRWARYLDTLYGVGKGYFFYDKRIDGYLFENLIIPHVAILGNHETGRQNHIRWPVCVVTTRSEPGYPRFVAANWMQLLFHWPFGSEGFYSEFRPDHPNMDPEQVREGYGKGGFGKLSFSNYLMLIGLDSSQNWEGAPDRGLNDWEGRPITEEWPWFETHHADVRQDLWLQNLLEPSEGPKAGDVYTHIIPIWHRGLFGTTRLNMSLKNRAVFENWLPILYRNGVKFVKEGHDHLYTRTVPLSVTTEQPPNTYTEKVPYEPLSWPLADGLSEEYRNRFFTVNTLKSRETDEIVGWEYAGYYTTYDPQGLIAHGHGGWAAGRRQPGQRGGGNAGLWFVDEAKGGESFGGSESYHITTVHLTGQTLTFESFHPEQLSRFENGEEPIPINRTQWNIDAQEWRILTP